MRHCSDWIDSFIKLTNNTEPPEIFHRWAAIGCIAACLQRKCVLPHGRLRFYPNLYIVLIAPPGRARKGTALDPVMQFLEEPRLSVRMASEALTREQLIRELFDSEAMYTGPDGLLYTHASLTILNSELTVFLGYNNPQQIKELTDWYDCKRHWSYRTKNSGSFPVTNVWVNILGATTPDDIRVSLPPTAIGGGLTSRIIFIYAGAKRGVVTDPDITQEEIELEEQLLLDLEQIAAIEGEYKKTEEFREIWREWYPINDANPPFSDAIFAGYCDRRPEKVMKLSIIMSASHSNELVVTGSDLLRAITTLEEAEINMPMALSGIGTGKHADVLARIMAEISLVKECPLDHIMWKFRNDVTRWELERLIGSLEAMQFCMYITNTHKIVYNREFEER